MTRSKLFTIIIGILTSATVLQAQLPEGYFDELVYDQFTNPVGILFVNEHIHYVWDRDGIIYIIEDGIVQEEKLIDISEEVASFGDLGMINIVIHPNFAENGYIFLAYAVDPHYLRSYGSDAYSWDKLGKWDSTIGRLTRYKVNVTNFKEIDPESRKILIGDQIGNGVPILSPSHGIGGLTFGADQTLLVGTGDGTTWVGNHTGGIEFKAFGFDSTGLEDGIIDESTDFGSYRAQLLYSLSGKILRIDPITGEGLPSNPYFQAQDPGSVQSRVWSLGFRFPFRMKLYPGSGSIEPADANPGTIFVSEIGSNQFEELDVVRDPGQNFGWPSFEGLQENKGYKDQHKAHPSLLNPLQEVDCQQHLLFDDLLIQPNKAHQQVWPNPCNPTLSLPDSLIKFVHARPLFAYGNTINNPLTVQIPTYDEVGQASYEALPADASHPLGVSFDGISSVVGDFNSDRYFPSPPNTYYHADFSGWIRSFEYDPIENQLSNGQIFHTNPGPIVFLTFNPYDRAMYYIILDYGEGEAPREIRKISYGANVAPIPQIHTDVDYGSSPLEVTFSAAESYDPNGDSIRYLWNFGGGIQSAQKDTTIVFLANSNDPELKTVKLTVFDEINEVSVEKKISLNNTPPKVEVINIPDTVFYTPNESLFSYDLIASAQDDEHDETMLTYQWEGILNHNDHSHLELTGDGNNLLVELYALANTSLDKYNYEVSVVVSDPHGLTGQDKIFFFPGSTKETNPEEDVIRIFPNPARTNLFLQIGTVDYEDFVKYQFRFLDQNGRIIYQEKINKLGYKFHLPFYVNDWPRGAYYFQLFRENELKFTEKVFLQ